MIALIASIAVSLVTSLLFGPWQVRKFRNAYQERLDAECADGTIIGYGMGAQAIGSWFERGVDYAANFPAFVLLLVAVAEVAPETSGLVVALIICAVAGSVAFLIYGEPAGKRMHSWKGVTAVSWAILGGNVATVLVAIAST